MNVFAFFSVMYGRAWDSPISAYRWTSFYKELFNCNLLGDVAIKGLQHCSSELSCVCRTWMVC